jgi:chromosome condensin MukBEF complex kleisin-like MukF subunit
MRSVVEDLYTGFPVFRFIGNQQCIDWWINFDKEVVEQEKAVNTIFCFRKNTIHDRLLECVQKHFSRKSLRWISQETDISQGYVQTDTKFLRLKT